MKMIIALSALLAVALAAPQQASYRDAVITSEQQHDNIGVDGYSYSFQTSNGLARQEQAQLKNAGTENEALVVSGSYSYTDPETNQLYTITYTADENGFHPEGAHIPSN